MAYYDGVKLLSLTDMNGNKPEIIISTSNRTGGKTTYFNRMVINQFKKNNSKFGLIYRYKYELEDCAEKFFKDIKELFFPMDELVSKQRNKGTYHELFLNGVSCGYAIPLNSSEQIKKLSHLFSDIDRMLLDEFQSESNNYCSDEIKKFLSIHTSIARGRGKQRRYVPVYLIGNPVSVINPYYVAMGISNRLRPDTKYLRGDGWVLEQGYVESASKLQMESGVSKAFAGNSYVAYSSQNVYLNDNHAFVEKPDGKSRYLATLRSGGSMYALREYAEMGYIYCDTNVDHTFPFKITVSSDDHQINYVMLKSNHMFINNLRYFFERGSFRFKDLKCKEVVLNMLSY